MKKKNIVMLVAVLAAIVIIVSTLLFLMNSRHNDFPLIYCENSRLNTFQYASASNRQFGIEINVITGSKEYKVEYLGATGLNVDHLKVTVNDDTFDNIRDISMHGGYAHLLGLGFECDQPNVQMDSIRLKIDGVEKTFSFPSPIRFEILEDESDAVSLPAFFTAVPSLIPERTISTVKRQSEFGETRFDFSFQAFENMTITDFGFNDFLVPKDAIVYVNEQEVGALESCLPLSLKKDDVVKVNCAITYCDEIQDNAYGNTYCFAYVSGYVGNSTVLQSSRAQIACQGICGEEDAKAFLEEKLN